MLVHHKNCFVLLDSFVGTLVVVFISERKEFAIHLNGKQKNRKDQFFSTQPLG